MVKKAESCNPTTLGVVGTLPTLPLKAFQQEGRWARKTHGNCLRIHPLFVGGGLEPSNKVSFDKDALTEFSEVGK